MSEREHLEQAIAALEAQRLHLGDAVVDDALAPLRQKLALLTSPEEAGKGERRIVTALFCDVAGSTSLAEQLDPEEWTGIMNGAFAHLTEPVIRYGGNITRLLGDAILALFGAPVAHEDDAERAVRAGLAILENIRAYRDQVRQQHGLEFDVRVGINTGLVVVGEVGSRDHGEYTAMGDAVNLAARMEQTARPGTVQIAHATYKLIQNSVEVEPLGPLAVKGKQRPVLAYRVLGFRARPARLPGRRAMQSPLIGREREISALQAALSHLVTGQGQIIFLIGEAGLGKSRLIQELKARRDESRRPEQTPAAGAARPRWLEAESLSFEGSQPYGLLQRLLRRAGHISQEDSEAAVRQKLSRLLSPLPPEQRSAFTSSLATLFMLDSETAGGAALEGEDLKHAILVGMLALVRAWATARPTVLVFEDLHWADPASVELISQLLPLTAESPLLLLCAFRPQPVSPAAAIRQAPAPEDSDRFLEIALQPLSAGDSNVLVGHLLDNAHLPENIGQLILARAEGVPFFVEEIVRELTERGTLIPAENGGGWRLAGKIEETHIPDTLEALLGARIDRLDKGVRRTLQLAAVIGRTFHYRVLAMLAGDGSQLEQHLDALQEAGMIQEVAGSAEPEYMFRHVLTQEAAYSTMLLRQRRQYHQRAGQVIEQLFAEQLDKEAPLLAHHFYEAGDDSRALPYLQMAAAGAARLYANDEAIMHYTRAIEAARNIPADAALLAGLHRGRGVVYERWGQFDQARADYEAALAAARSAADRRREWRALLDLGKLWASRNYDRMGDYVRQALALARQLNDAPILARSLNWMGNWFVNAEMPDEARQHYLEALAIFEEQRDQPGVADTLDHLGMNAALSGDYDSGRDYFDRAIAMFRESDNRTRLISSLQGQATMGHEDSSHVAYHGLSLPQRVNYVAEALRLAQEIGWRSGEAISASTLGLLYYLAGDYGQALNTLRSSLQLARDIEHRQWTAGILDFLGVFYCGLLAGEEALPNAEESLALAREIHSQYWTNLAAGTVAHAQLLLGDVTASRATLAEVIGPETPMNTVARRYCWQQRLRVVLVRGAAEEALALADRLIASQPGLPPDGVIVALWRHRAAALAALGRPADAEAYLRAALASATGSGERSQVWRIRGGLGQLLRQTGRLEEAERELSQARAEIDKLARTIPEAPLRQKFRQRAHEKIQPAG